MTDDFDLLDEIYSRLKKNEEFALLVGNPKSADEWNRRVRREIYPLSEATADNVNFIQIYFSSATETDNVFVSRGFLNVDYFAKSRVDCAKMKKVVMEVLSNMDLHCTSMYNEPPIAKGVFRYTQKYRPLVWA